MNIIPIEHHGVLFINIFSVQPKNQQALIDCIRATDATDTPGLIAAHLLRSLNGTKVINHMVWESREAFREATKSNPKIAATRHRVQELIESAAPDIYEIIEVK